ncbi:alpha/beta hydrolase protein [Dacryopinax primogenitus]|uniref:Alpha/beta hydrolase protein n=1 Tax=Dacryopinax primogenitus (strain DJM 731) TaxID=1858805 RepID=M5GC80_DACPD|nr:alpha/beta hydrolase protein [Dacryopinax primogenitus]EJU06639.1 alpha/beta hydrolase protein [Dacryopinax primogenitus]
MPIPFDQFEEFSLPVSSPPSHPTQQIVIHVVRAGSGPPMLLLHGSPETSYMWHLVAPTLADHFSVVVCDLRGYGKSSKPEVDPAQDKQHELYSKREMARDNVEVMKQLGFDSFYVLAHDRGARVTHRMVLDYPGVVKKFILLDIAPTLAMYEGTNMAFATAYYHWFFFIQPAPFPEMLLSSFPEALVYKSFVRDGHPTPDHPNLQKYDTKALAEYIEAAKTPGTIHAICEDYRASAGIDIERDREDLRKGTKIGSPMKVFWGSKGIIGKNWDPIMEWTKVCQGGIFIGGREIDSGHFIPEEQPGEIIKEAMDFFKE